MHERNQAWRSCDRTSFSYMMLGLIVLASMASLTGCGNEKRDIQDKSPKQVATSSAKIATLASDLSAIRQFVDRGQLDAARKAIEAYLIRFPDDMKAMVLAADIYRRRNRLSEAVSMLDSAIQQQSDEDPGSDPSALQLQASRLLRQQGRWQESIDRLERILERNQLQHQVRHELVQLLNERGYRFQANQHVRMLCRHNQATATELRGLIFPTRSTTGFNAKPDIHDQAMIDRLGILNAARGLHSEGDVQEAADLLARSELIQQKHPGAVAFYGRVLMDAQRFDEFGAWLELVVEECKKYPDYWIAVGDWATRQREPNAAVRFYVEAIMREPGDLAANDRLMKTLAAAEEPELSDRFRERGVMIDRSMNVARQIFSSSPLDRGVANLLPQLLNEIGRPLEALAWYRIILTQMGASAESLSQVSEGLRLLDNEERRNKNVNLRLCGIDLQSFPLELDWLNERSSVSKASQGWQTTFAKPIRPVLRNVADDTGLHFRYRNAEEPVQRHFRIYEQPGGGVACLDYDLDGKADVYFAQAAADPPVDQGKEPNLLSRNIGDRFRNVTDFAQCDDRQYSCGVTSGDWNQDGFPDLLVANVQRNTLFINCGDGTFSIHEGSSDWNQAAYTTSVAMGDVTGDHLPDIIEINYIDDQQIFDPIRFRPDGTPVHIPAPLDFRCAYDRVFTSIGDGQEKASTLRDSNTSAATGLGVLVTNIDDDAGNEIFVANDRLANHLWIRERTNKADDLPWRNVAALRGVAYGAKGAPLGCMGIAASDFDGNGKLDLHVTNFEGEWSNQYMQRDGGNFDDLVVEMGLGKPSYNFVGFGTQALDYDNNRSVDLIVGQGHVDDYTAEGRGFQMPTKLFSLAKGGKFLQQSVAGDPDYWNQDHLSRGMAVLDWNRDGRLDIVVSDLQSPAVLLENQTETPHHWIQIKLVGTNAERDAIGATAVVKIGGELFTYRVASGDGYMAKNESVLHFGVGSSSLVGELEIHWPDGQLQTLTNLPVDHRFLIVQGQDRPFFLNVDPEP